MVDREVREILERYCRENKPTIYERPEEFLRCKEFLLKQRYTGKLYRETSYEPLTQVKEGDIIDYTNRFTSWSTEYDVADCRVCEKSIILILDAKDIPGYDVKRFSDYNEKEVLCAPGLKLRVGKRVGIKVYVEQCETSD